MVRLNSSGNLKSPESYDNFKTIMKSISLKTAVAFLISAAALPLSAQYYGIEEPVMGRYVGTFKTGDDEGRIEIQIRPLGEGAYDGFIQFQKGATNVGVLKVKSAASDQAGVIAFTGNSIPIKGATTAKKVEIKGKIVDGKISGNFTGEMGQGSLEGKKTPRKSPTLGLKPPPDAIVIFDGKNTNHFKKFNWKLTEDGAMQVQGGDIFVKDEMQNFKLHLEFRTPFMPKERDQARGNSGVYLQSIYEVQVLDSFGLYPLQINDCGSIYGVKTAEGNLCLPPMEWQTYDIVYLNGDGTTNDPPTITILHNGIATIKEARVPADKVGKGGGGGNPGSGVLKLQDHGNAVQYRNIWVEPIKK